MTLKPVFCSIATRTPFQMYFFRANSCPVNPGVPPEGDQQLEMPADHETGNLFPARS